MLSKEDNELLTKTDSDTPMGDLLRRYWIPALLSEEIPDIDCSPVKVRLLGEDLVAFRDSKGRVGLLGENCAHRGTSLFYGRNEDCGLRCIYHGWKYDVEGNIVDTPAEPYGSDFKRKLRHKAYPCRESAGMVFTFMGPADKIPFYPEYEWTQLPSEQTYVTKAYQECNYLQGLEGDCDSSHVSYLHRTNQEIYQKQSGAPTLIAEEADFGVRMISIRKSADTNYVRITNFIMPITGHVSAHSNSVHYWVPIDDNHSWKYSLAFSTAEPIAENFRVSRREETDADYKKYRNLQNHYLQARLEQKTKTFTGIEGYLAQDSCVTETMSPIYDRSKEHLGASDVAVIAVRKFLLNAVQGLMEGKEPPCLITDPENTFRAPVSTGKMLPLNVSWREELLGEVEAKQASNG